jgi:bifunctional non-homologous end joining protein LigD
MSLSAYRKKRNFKLTDEPPAGKREARKKAAAQFVIQKHDATRLHYDFRLEMGGALKSWAVPKGLPAAKGERRLAVMVEDHPMAYGGFEGTIPKGEYGGGTVMLWDRGTWEPMSRTPAKDLSAGKLHFILHGEKLRGEWYLVRLRDENQWLIIKGGEDMKPVSKKLDDTSVLSGKSMRQIAGDAGQPKSRRAAAKSRAVRTSAAPKIPSFIEPMKARLAAEAPPGEWLYEIKFDGWRALALRGGAQIKLLSRNEKDLGAKFPEITEAVAALRVSDVILDGEIVAIDEAGRSSFQLLQAYDMGQERPPIFFYVFDLLQLNGRNLTGLPLTERKAALEELLEKQRGVIRNSAVLGRNAKALMGKARELGLEGLIGKRPDSVYEPGSRSGAWIKLKLHREQEFVIGGYTDPEGSRHAFGSVIVGYYAGRKLQFAGKVGTGFNTDLLRSLHARFKTIAAASCPFAGLPEPRGGKWSKGITASEMKRCHWLKPVLVCQVKFSEWTRDGRLRQPVFLGLREDKKPAEVVRESPA